MLTTLRFRSVFYKEMMMDKYIRQIDAHKKIQ